MIIMIKIIIMIIIKMKTSFNEDAYLTIDIKSTKQIQTEKL